MRYTFIDAKMTPVDIDTYDLDLEIEEIEIHDVDWYNDDDPETQAAMNLEDTRRFLDYFKLQGLRE